MDGIQRLEQPRLVTLLVLSSFMVAMAVTFVMERSALFDPYVINDDVRQHIYWMARFQDPDLFRGDPLTDFFSSPKFATYGVVGLYYLMSFFVEPLVFSKILPLLLIPLCAVFLFLLGRRLKDLLSGLILVAVFLTVIWDRDRFSGGLARSFSYPILILFLYSLVQKRYLAASALMVAGALFYPPIAPVCAGTWAFSFLDLPQLRVNFRQNGLAPFLIGSVLTSVVLISAYIVFKDEAAGRLVAPTEAAHMPEFYRNGRVEFFHESPIVQYLQGEDAGLGLHGPVNVLFFTAVLIGLVLRSEAFKTPKEVWHLMLSSLSLFLLAYLVLFRLHLPSRFSEVPISLCLMIFASIHLRPALQKIARLIPYDRLRSRPVAVAEVVGVTLVLFFFIVGVSMSRAKLEHFPDGSLTSFLATLHKDALIAGHPEDMDWIPIFSKRRVLVNRELSLPYHVEYYGEIRRRTLDTLEAYYTDSLTDIARFCRKYGVDYLVVNRSRFTSDSLQTQPIYDEPYNASLKAKIAGRERFAALMIPPEKIVWQDSKFLVTDCRRLVKVKR
ncbi:MAG: hypothetical protein HY347_11800 [candidate division NC10 bacterium]|nr:hypothetical protein [candidate division NC10 bacterium]